MGQNAMQACIGRAILRRTVYVKTNRRAYNSGMHSEIRRRLRDLLRKPVIVAVAVAAVAIGGALFAVTMVAQDTPGALTVATKKIPAASLWSPYTFRLQAGSGTQPYHWRG